MKCSRLFRPSLIAALLLGGFFSSLRGASQTANPGENLTSIIATMNSGDILVLKNGDHTPFVISGKSGITIRAENERRAVIKGNGGTAVDLQNCSGLTLEGLTAKSSDNSNSSLAWRSVVNVQGGSGNKFRRLLLANTNRMGNNSLFLVQSSNSNSFEECEFYYFHRYGLILKYSNNNLVRSCYANSKGHNTLGYNPSPDGRGDSGFQNYPGANNVFDSCISEGNGGGFSVEADGNSIANLFRNSIAINCNYGVLTRAKERATLEAMPQNTRVENFVSVGARYYGVYSRSSKNTQVINSTLKGSGLGGVAADFINGSGIQSECSISSSNSLALKNNSYGFFASSVPGSWTNCNAFGQSSNYAPGVGSGNTSTDPGAVACPATSGSKGANIDMSKFYFGAVVESYQRTAAQVLASIGCSGGGSPPPATGVTVSQNNVPAPQPSTPGASPAIGVPLLIGGVILAALLLGD